ncbi:MAG: hypothetical protein F2813_05550 [Actinobacteria bacterium]|uniref:Unannotated protein n=1 Tax=freshwater metagenome TaxID=449393 RepID=A0A6J5ZWA7_9ZZZZ|nr:hypothetical protein [Actinomycetota bacterium]
MNKLAPRRLLTASALSLLGVCLLASSAGAKSSYREPALTVNKEKLAASLHCPVPIVPGGKQPMMLVTGTGYTGAQAYLIGKPALLYGKRPICYVNFPYKTTEDIQISAEYLVAGIRSMAKTARKPISVFGISQGGLLPRWALTYWPSLRSKVTDVIAVAGTQHGTNLIGNCSELSPCMPAVWQQRAGSNLLNAINAQRDESPNPTSWTTVRTAGDETVQPQTGPNPTSSLRGATNILIQDVCPGRVVGHIASGLDSVSYAAFNDAVDHKGPAKQSRLPANVCDHPRAPGFPYTRAAAFTPDLQVNAPTVGAEPRVRAYAKKRVP